MSNDSYEKQIKKKEQKEKLARQKELNDILHVLSTAEGRRFVWGILERCGVYRSSFHTESSITYLNEGRRDVGLQLIADITEADPMSYIRMKEERLKENEYGSRDSQ